MKERGGWQECWGFPPSRFELGLFLSFSHFRELGVFHSFPHCCEERRAEESEEGSDEDSAEEREQQDEGYLDGGGGGAADAVCEINPKQPRPPYTLYQDRGVLYLIPPCESWQVSLHRCALTPRQYAMNRAELSTLLQLVPEVRCQVHSLGAQVSLSAPRRQRRRARPDAFLAQAADGERVLVRAFDSAASSLQSSHAWSSEQPLCHKEFIACTARNQTQMPASPVQLVPASFFFFAFDLAARLSDRLGTCSLSIGPSVKKGLDLSNVRGLHTQYRVPASSA
eukprot:2541120-Rhodomonas_salina.1